MDKETGGKTSDELTRLLEAGVRMSGRDKEEMIALRQNLSPDLYQAVIAGLESGMARARASTAPDFEKVLPNIDSPDADPLEGVMDTSAPEASLGERPARRERRGRRRLSSAEIADADYRQKSTFLAGLRRNMALEDAGLQSFRNRPDSSEMPPAGPNMTRGVPPLEQMSSRPQPRPYTEGPMSSTEDYYAATRRSADPMVRGAGMRFRPR
jgi:hypothetical protein